MRPTILAGDRIVVSRIAYDVRVPFFGLRVWRRGDPAHGDLVVYVRSDGTRAVKRVIGVPGDRIAVRDHRVVRNGLALTHASGTTTDSVPGYRLYREDSTADYSVMIKAAEGGPVAVTLSTVPDGDVSMVME